MPDVAGLVPLSTTDFPGRLSAVVFLHGCPWRCRYCQNPELQPRPARGELPWESVLRFLDQRRGLLDAVVFSGGEPTLQASLGTAVNDVRARGFAVGLHTAGIYPRRLAEVLPRLDWVGLDVKAPFEDYPRVIGRATGAAAARESLDLLLAAGVEFEVRTTWHPSLIGEGELVALAEALAGRGVRRYALQAFDPQGCRDPRLLAQGPAAIDSGLAGRISSLFDSFALRHSGAATA